MILYRLFDPLRLNAYIPLRGAGTAMLQQSLYQGNIEAVAVFRQDGCLSSYGAGGLKCQNHI